MSDSGWLLKSVGYGMALGGKWIQGCGFTPSVSEALHFAGNLPGIREHEAQRYFNDAARRLQDYPPEVWVGDQLSAAAKWCGYTDTPAASKKMLDRNPQPPIENKNSSLKKNNEDYTRGSVPSRKAEDLIRFTIPQQDAFQGRIVGYDIGTRTLTIQENMPGGFPMAMQVPDGEEAAHQQLCKKGRGVNGRSIAIGDDGMVCIAASQNERNPSLLRR